MKRMKRKWIVCLLSLLLLTQLIPFGAGAETAEFDPYYCRGALETLPNAKALLYAYDQIVLGVENCLDEITVYNGTDPISADEVRVVLDAYRRDYAEHFWFGNTYSMSYNSTSIIKLLPTYVMEGETLETAKREFEAAIESLLSDITDVMTEYEREKLLHDKLAALVTYVEAPNAHNAYGALVEGKAVCEGYAEALQCLLHRVGIQSLIVLGSSINPATGTPENHAWNMIRIDGLYYHTDLTWNDQGRTLYHAYFNQTDAVIKEDHTITQPVYALPSCNATAANYFNVEGGMLNTYTVDSVAALLKSNDLSVNVYVPGNTKTFIEWFCANISAIAAKAGVKGSYSYRYAQMGREIVLGIEVCKHTAMTPVSAVAVSCTENGNEAYYICSCGKWFEDAAAEREIGFRDSVVIYATGHKWTEKLEDAAHLKAETADCRNGDSYWYDCAVCDAVSDSEYFFNDNKGDHVYATEWSQGDENGHWHTCLYCDAHDEAIAHDTDSKKVCKDCGYDFEAPPKESETVSNTVKPNNGASVGSGSTPSFLSGCVVSLSNLGTVGASLLIAMLLTKKKRRR